MPALGAIVEDSIVLDKIAVDCVVVDTVLARTCLNKTPSLIPVVRSSRILPTAPDTILVKWDRPMAVAASLGAKIHLTIDGVDATGVIVSSVTAANPKQMTIQMATPFDCRSVVKWNFKAAASLLATDGKDPGIGQHLVINQSGSPRPVITFQPTDQNPQYNTPATLVIVINPPVTRIQWYKDGLPIPGAITAGATTATYTTPPVTSNAKYKCLVTSPCGTRFSDEVEVTVNIITADSAAVTADIDKITVDRSL